MKSILFYSIVAILLLSSCSHINPTATIMAQAPVYAEAYYHSYSGNTITITTEQVYYNITGIIMDDYNAVELLDHSIRVLIGGTYKITGTMSFNGGNGGEYELELFVNDAEQEDCAFFRSTSTTAIGDATLSCLKVLYPGDVLVMKVKDISAPPQDITIQTLNFNMFKI